MKCRRCKTAEGTIFLDARNQPTKTPVCQECHEQYIRLSEGKGGFVPGYHGPGRDPYHPVDLDHVKASDWYELQYMDGETDE